MQSLQSCLFLNLVSVAEALRLGGKWGLRDKVQITLCRPHWKLFILNVVVSDMTYVSSWRITLEQCEEWSGEDQKWKRGKQFGSHYSHEVRRSWKLGLKQWQTKREVGRFEKDLGRKMGHSCDRWEMWIEDEEDDKMILPIFVTWPNEQRDIMKERNIRTRGGRKSRVLFW